jgi:hypothetical protein
MGSDKTSNLCSVTGEEGQSEGYLGYTDVAY